jgi:hypothetical protein
MPLARCFTRNSSVLSFSKFVDACSPVLFIPPFPGPLLQACVSFHVLFKAPCLEVFSVIKRPSCCSPTRGRPLYSGCTFIIAWEFHWKTRNRFSQALHPVLLSEHSQLETPPCKQKCSINMRKHGRGLANLRCRHPVCRSSSACYDLMHGVGDFVCQAALYSTSAWPAKEFLAST